MPTDLRTLLFEGLDAEALADVVGRMKPRSFEAHAVICQQGEAGDSLFLIKRGVAQAVIEEPEGRRSLGRLRRGEVIGEISLVTGEPRSASVVANVPTEVLELTRVDFAALVARHPEILANLSRILGLRLARRTQESTERRRGEAVALVTGPAGSALVADLIAATKAASPRPVAVLDSTASPAAADPTPHDSSAASVLAALDDLLDDHGTVLIVAEAGQRDLALLLEHMDRAVAVTTEAETQTLSNLPPAAAEQLEVVLLTADPASAPATANGLRVTRALDPHHPSGDVAWLGRHLSRTKLGLVLGAGGAKGYAHVGVLHVLEDAGYTVDYVAGSSIGSVVGAWLALGMSAPEIETTMRKAFDPEKVKDIFKLSLTGMSAGVDDHIRMCRETTGERTFSDLRIPLVAMAVDLGDRKPAPIREGPLWEALVASTALAGMFPPFERDRQRLVDGLALVPVPTGEVLEAGADVAISVNLMSHETLDAWPGHPPPPPPEPSRSRMLATLLEVMDLMQIDNSVRHAAMADVVITPRFGPGTWRDFHLADLFMAAGREAAQGALARLRAHTRPHSV